MSDKRDLPERLRAFHSKIMSEAADEIDGLRAQLAEEKAKHALTIQHADGCHAAALNYQHKWDHAEEQLASARKALGESRDAIMTGCNTIDAVAAIDTALTDDLRGSHEG